MAGNYHEPQVPIMQNGDFYYPLTTAKQVILPDNRRLGGENGINLNADDVNALSIDTTDAEAGTANLINADSLGGVAASRYVLDSELDTYKSEVETNYATKTEVSTNYLLKTKAAADSNLLGGKAPIYYIQPRNLLDNSDFTNPVNQRGITTTDSSFTGYVLDRWIAQNSGTLITINSNGLNVTASSGTYYLYQRLDNVKNGKTYTFAAALSDGTIGVCAFTLSSTTSTWEWIKEVRVSSSLQIGVAHANWMPLFVAVSNLTNTSARIIWAALYEGSYTADTLPPYVPKGYAAEFAECRRYYKRFTAPYAGIYSSGYVTSSTKNIYINPPDNYPMRIAKPSCAFSGKITVRGISGYIAEDYSDAVFTVYSEATGCVSSFVITRGDSAAWSATNNTPVVVQFHANSVLELIADL